MGDRSWLLHRGKLGDKEEKRKTGDRRNPPDFPLSGALWEHRNRHELSSAPPAAYRLREEENPGSWFASLLSSGDPRQNQGVCLQNAYPPLVGREDHQEQSGLRESPDQSAQRSRRGP